MKDVTVLPIERPAGSPVQWQSKSTPSRLARVRIIAGALAILSQGMTLGSKGQVPVPLEQGSRPAQTVGSSVSLPAVEGRKQPSYQVFAAHFTAPSLTVTNQTTLEVGGKQVIDVSRPDQLTRQQKETLAGQFDVPTGVIDNVMESFSRHAPADAAEAAGKLRIRVIDYKYLVERWNRYRPPAGQENVKTNALLALQGGDVDKAWAMYADLARPKPPAELRVAGGDSAH